MKLVKDVVKAKLFAVLPGSGMSIEVTLERGDKVRRINIHVVVYAPSHLLLLTVWHGWYYWQCAL